MHNEKAIKYMKTPLCLYGRMGADDDDWRLLKSNVNINSLDKLINHYSKTYRQVVATQGDPWYCEEEK